jgi:hypothetical protein
MVHSSKKPPLPELHTAFFIKFIKKDIRVAVSSRFADGRRCRVRRVSQQRKKGFLEENENIFKFFILAALT